MEKDILIIMMMMLVVLMMMLVPMMMFIVIEPNVDFQISHEESVAEVVW